MTDLAADQIAACNVRPAYETSQRFGATTAELEAIGLRPELLRDGDAPIPAEATYRHMALMFAKPDYPRFLVEAARAHNLSSLGVVGLACKTVATLGEAMVCHQRYQHLTNRTAHYASSVADGELRLTEERSGPEGLGRDLVSDYTMLVAVHLIRDNAAGDVGVRGIHSVRSRIPDEERAAIEEFVGAPLELGAPRATLRFDAAAVITPVKTADPEMARYFEDVLTRAARFEPDEDAMLTQVRLAIRDALVQGTPTAAEIAKRLGLGQRTLQRRLAERGESFSDVLDGTRRMLAQGYLGDAALTLAEVGYLLGFREPASFYRAFRRWFDTTPSAYRASPTD